MTNYGCADCGWLVKANQKNCNHCWSELTWDILSDYECADCGGLVKYQQRKCKHCWSELVWNNPNEEINNTKDHKKPNAFAIWCFSIIALIVLILIFSSLLWGNSTYTPTIKSYWSLSEAYHAHRNFIRTTCKAALKVDRWVEDGIEWPTYAWEYMGEFVIKGWYGWSTTNQFSCIFQKSNNEWWMDIVDVK